MQPPDNNLLLFLLASFFYEELINHTKLWKPRCTGLTKFIVCLQTGNEFYVFQIDPVFPVNRVERSMEDGLEQRSRCIDSVILCHIDAVLLGCKRLSL